MPIRDDIAIRGGRPRRWLVGAAITAGIVAAPLLVAAPATATATATPPTSCEIERLPELPGWSMSIVTAADPTGRYIAGRGYPPNLGDGKRYPVIWRDGIPTSIDIPGFDQSIKDITSTGDAVAMSFAPRQAWRYHDGVLTPIFASDVEHVAINERGDIAGYRNTADGLRPFIARADDVSATPVDLPLPAGADRGWAQDIANDGTVVGYYWDASFRERPYRWVPNGNSYIGEDLPLPEKATEAMAHTARDGWALGIAYGNSPLNIPARWNLRTGKAETFPQFQGPPQEVNAHGWQVGRSPAGEGLFVSDAGNLTLPALTDHNDLYGDSASTINNDGSIIAGQAIDTDGEISAVAWHCG